MPRIGLSSKGFGFTSGGPWAATGGTEVIYNGRKFHIFKSTDNLVVSGSGSKTVNAFVLGAGGGGGSPTSTNNIASGGGATGHLYVSSVISLSAGQHACIIGAGGTLNNLGNISNFAGFTTEQGQRGGEYGTPFYTPTPSFGAGSGDFNFGSGVLGQTGIIRNGGRSYSFAGGGGSGQTSNGGSATTSYSGGPGGSGSLWGTWIPDATIVMPLAGISATHYGGGGGGASYYRYIGGGTGGTEMGLGVHGGGNAAAHYPVRASTNAITNTGSGGGGGTYYSGTNLLGSLGGSGIIVVWYTI